MARVARADVVCQDDDARLMELRDLGAEMHKRTRDALAHYIEKHEV